jgi:hypothetical protein
VALLLLLLAVGIFAGSGWVVVAGFATYAATSLVRSMQPSFRQRLRRRAAERAAQLPEPHLVRDEAVRLAVYAVIQARTELDEALSEAPEWLAPQVSRATGSARTLLRHAAGLARHAEYIHTHLERTGVDGVRRELARLTEARERAADPALARQYQQASALRRQQLAAIDELQRARQHDLAGLARVISSLHAARARALCLRATRGGIGEARLLGIHEEIANLDGELAISEHAAASLGAATSS